MAIPSGYRLLTAEDIGKVFGVDLELEIKFDTDQDPVAGILSNGNTQLTNFVRGILGSGAEDYKNIEINSETVYAFGWFVESYTFTENVEITSYNTDISNWNNWLYVKDVSDPYKIKMTKPYITIDCKDKKMTENLVIQAPESGGGGSTGKSFTLNFDTPDQIDVTVWVDGVIEYEKDGYYDGPLVSSGNSIVVLSNVLTDPIEVTSITGAKYVSLYNSPYLIYIIIEEDNAVIDIFYSD